MDRFEECQSSYTYFLNNYYLREIAHTPKLLMLVQASKEY